MGIQLALISLKKDNCSLQVQSLAMKTIHTLVDCCAWIFGDGTCGFFTFAACICCDTQLLCAQAYFLLLGCELLPLLCCLF